LKIERIETLRADAGWRLFSYVKLTTACGVTGWSEYNESFGSRGLTDVVNALAPLILGMDPRAHEAITAHLHVLTRQSRGGLNQQAIAALENAVLDAKGKALGLPVYRLFGGPIRNRIPVYWSHFGTYRVGQRAGNWYPPLDTYEQLAAHAAEVKAQGFKAMKTNILRFIDGRFQYFNPGFGRTPGFPELNWDQTIERWTRTQLQCIRDAVGPDQGLMLDINFHFKTEGFRRIADTVAPFDMTWLEIDSHDPRSLATIRENAPCPIASCETLHGRRDFKPFFEHYAMDVPIIDVIWNGLGESLKIAAMADAYEMNVAPHNFYGNLCSAISAHFSACVPNLRIMEIDLDHIPWQSELTPAPRIEDSCYVLNEQPGWGVEPDEAAIRRHPPKA
jgi:L-alanine-DL-glutamate epimerase-like enolase superfamily enzyme